MHDRDQRTQVPDEVIAPVARHLFSRARRYLHSGPGRRNVTLSLWAAMGIGEHGGSMRYHLLFLALIGIGCRSHDQVQVASTNQEWTVPPPVGLVGDWIQIRPKSRRGDTLTLRADSTATGPAPAGRLDWYPGDTNITTISRWGVKFMSHEPSTQRADWWGGHKDGGEYSCFSNPDEKCRSGPMLCLGDADNFGCTQFRFGHDSLALGTGDRYVRARHLQTEVST
jgi:hypothetical protein